MKKIEFGSLCGKFSVALSGNDIVLPGSKNQPLKFSLIACADPNRAAGQYTLEVKSGGSIVANMPVHAMWVTHKSQPEPFLGLKAEYSTELRESLVVSVGQAVELVLTPRENA